MAVNFFDSSGIVKRYVSERGSLWVATIVNPAAGNFTYLANLTGVEVISAITRRQRGGTISQADATLTLAQFRHDFANEYYLLEITPPLVAPAMKLAETHALRGYDAIQLAAALEVSTQAVAKGLIFSLVSADVELNTAAAVEGLTVENPNNYP